LFYSVPLIFQSGKWCKGKTYFSNHQNFLKVFLENFQNLSAYPFKKMSLFLRKADTKVNQFFEPPKLFEKFFQEIFRTFLLIRSRRIFFGKRMQR